MKLGIKTCIIIVLTVLINITSATYIPSSKDQSKIETVTTSLRNIIDNDSQTLRNFYVQLNDLQIIFKDHEQLSYLLEQIATNIHQDLQDMKKPKLLEGLTEKQSLVNNYSSGIIKEHSIPQRCRDSRQLLDDMSFVYNIPTAITLATRYAETTCGYYLPIHPTYGSNGPFQIITKDYGTGEMTPKLFRQTIQDFLEFSHNKYNSYARANSKSGLTVGLSYEFIDKTGVIRHGSLYNGLSGRTIMGDIQPMKRRYIFNNYEPAYSGAVRHGLFPMVIKSVERELNNIYPRILEQTNQISLNNS